MDYNAADQDLTTESSRRVLYSCASLLYQDISTSLKQWKIFHCVVECGSFASAAEFIGVSQATVSYAITQLEETLGIPLLKLEGRKYKLTKLGHELLRRSRGMLSDAAALEKYAAALRTENKLEVKLAIGREFPTRLIIPAIRKLSCSPHSPKITIFELSGEDVEQSIRDNEVDVAINTSIPSGFEADQLVRIQYIAVASTEHPLANYPGPIGRDELGAHVQIVCRSDQSIDSHPSQYDVGGVNRWHVSSAETAITAICEGVGFGWVPSYQVKDSLWRGALKALPLSDNATFELEFNVIRRRDTALAADVDRVVGALRAALNSVRVKG